MLLLGIDVGTSSIKSALSEGISWDFATNSLSKDILDHFGMEVLVQLKVRALELNIIHLQMKLVKFI